MNKINQKKIQRFVNTKKKRTLLRKQRKPLLVNRALLRKIRNQIVDTVHPEKIILFGSWARGDATLYSDVDLMVVKKEAFGKTHSRRQELTKLWLSLASIPVPKDIVLYSSDEIEHWKQCVNHLISKALREGKVLYGKI